MAGRKWRWPTVGKEGVVGASELIQAQGAMGLNLVQLPGLALRIESSACLKLLDTRPPIRKLAHQHFLRPDAADTLWSACNRIHSMEERCARWLLMTHDRAGQDYIFHSRRIFFLHMLACGGRP